MHGDGGVNVVRHCGVAIRGTGLGCVVNGSSRWMRHVSPGLEETAGAEASQWAEQGLG